MREVPGPLLDQIALPLLEFHLHVPEVALPGHLQRPLPVIFDDGLLEFQDAAPLAHPFLHLRPQVVAVEVRDKLGEVRGPVLPMVLHQGGEGVRVGDPHQADRGVREDRVAEGELRRPFAAVHHLHAVAPGRLEAVKGDRRAPLVEHEHAVRDVPLQREGCPQIAGEGAGLDGAQQFAQGRLPALALLLALGRREPHLRDHVRMAKGDARYYNCLNRGKDRRNNKF